jgi:uncharacterized protein (TIGR03790 family)
VGYLQPRQLIPLVLLALLTAGGAFAQTPDQVLVVVNKQSAASREIGEYYLRKRGVPLKNLCTIDTKPEETIQRPVYDQEIEAPIAAFLKENGLVESILYIVTTSGVPLRIETTGGSELNDSAAAVDSELTLVYRHLHGVKTGLQGFVPNPFFRQRDTPFRHPLFPMYLVTRLSAYDVATVKKMVDRSLAARNRGNFVVDAKIYDSTEGNQWLRTAALLLPKDRVVFDDTATVITGQKDVIAYASWGSNDRDHKQRFLHFQWLPGAIATEFVSTDGRTMKRPPDTWRIGAWTDSRSTWFEGAPQSMAGDYLDEGASAASGQVFEPYLQFCPRPDFILPAYYSGRTLAESFYMGIPALSWMNVVFGDPLMRLLP